METIERLRVEMIELANSRGELCHPDVLDMSQRLDVLLVEELYRQLRLLDTVSRGNPDRHPVVINAFEYRG